MEDVPFPRHLSGTVMAGVRNTYWECVCLLGDLQHHHLWAGDDEALTNLDVLWKGYELGHEGSQR